MQNIIDFVIAHSAAICFCLYMIGNVVVYFNKSIASNSIFEAIMNFLASKKDPAAKV